MARDHLAELHSQFDGDGAVDERSPVERWSDRSFARGFSRRMRAPCLEVSKFNRQEATSHSPKTDILCAERGCRQYRSFLIS